MGLHHVSISDDLIKHDPERNVWIIPCSCCGGDRIYKYRHGAALNYDKLCDKCSTEEIFTLDSFKFRDEIVECKHCFRKIDVRIPATEWSHRAFCFSCKKFTEKYFPEKI